MKKLLLKIILFLLSICFVLIFFLSTVGYETDKLNNFIENKAIEKNPSLNLSINKIKIKIDVKKANIFLTTKKPSIKYGGIKIQINEIKVYMNFSSLFKKEINLDRIIFDLEELKVEEMQELAKNFKPSNFKSFVKNKIKNGTISTVIDLEINEDLNIEEYNVVGLVKGTNIDLINKISIKKTSFNFTLNKDLIILNSINCHINNIPITSGEIKIIFKDQIEINGYLQANINTKKDNSISTITNFYKNSIFDNNISLEGNFTNNFKIILDKTLDLKNYSYDLNGNIKKAEIIFKNSIKNKILINNIDLLKIDNTNIQLNLANKKNQLNLTGKYKINNNPLFMDFKIINDFNKHKSKFKVDFDFKDKLILDILNYRKDEDKKAKILSEFEIHKNKVIIKKLKYKENNSIILVEELQLDNQFNINLFNRIKIDTYDSKKIKNNDFEIKFQKEILINGSRFDATNIIKEIKSKNKDSKFKKITKEIKINIKEIFSKDVDSLNNFFLIGKVEKGKFIKILAKSEFKDNNFLEISLKKIPNTKKKSLEIYSDSPKVLLKDFKFFKGVLGGKLLFTSTFDEEQSISNLRIEKFKVSDAPAFAKLLTLADLGGVSDLLSGDGISFSELEINLNKNNDTTNIEEIYAVGPSISVLMDGYVDNNSGLISLKGTMVPAKELNKLVAKIPIIGDILIGKEIGEGLFGVSFKMKGMPGKVKTIVNPIETLTPRFITRALKKKKKK